ncbi:MAG: hypothetical protein JJ847_05795 [Prochlorococcus marinus CUG1438]|nr:hypothetical protein [Prochlorococcus marinus CUG1438]
MRKLLILCVLLFLSGCGYGSQMEAYKACEREWYLLYSSDEYQKKIWGDHYFRTCQNEPSSRKVLGLYKTSRFGSWQVGKRFSY